ncbi:hypothetical protein PybrP1_009580 [[Pythium] brassicae (nom. inval.)]|nr:hypothetical protein PybrP1_009580 [[Pythium] brassicae (nom. inval.)]
MESKGTATLSSGGGAHQWWRWSSGKSSVIASSSDSLSSDRAAFGATAAGSSSTSLSLSSSSAESLRWPKRSGTAGGGLSPSSSSGSLSPPSLFSPATTALSARALPPASSRKKPSASVARPTSSRDTATVLKKKAGPSSSSSLSPSPSPPSAALAASASHFASSSRAASDFGEREIAWSVGPSKRRVKKASKAPAGPPSRRASLFGASSRSGVSQPTVRSGSHRFSSVAASSASAAPSFAGYADKAASPKDRVPSPTSSLASTVSSSSYAPSPSSYAKNDPLANCARAVWQDCIMSKRRMERSSMRKRNIDDCVKSDYLNAKTGAYMAKSSECGILSSCSSSSDDELSQLSSMERSFNSGNKFDDDYKLSKEEMYRELMLGDNGLSSSPDFERFSPFLDEEKGLPVEIRYQLPLALGTANEIDKECTICQIRYGIGDHIVTLPCQHFFHACCVDKWLWNHTSCPLCRTEVTLDMETDVPSTAKHNFTECSQFDQDTIRRKMRSTSQSAGFRPVVPGASNLRRVYVDIQFVFFFALGVGVIFVHVDAIVTGDRPKSNARLSTFEFTRVAAVSA